MKKFIIAIIILLVLAAGFFGWWFYFKNSDGGTSGSFSLSDWNPFGGSDVTTPPNTNNTTQSGTTTVQTTNNNVPATLPRLRKISDEPISGAVIVNATSSNVVRYIDKATGNMYEAQLAVASKKRISNTTIPKVSETAWLSSGEGLVMRYVRDDDSIESFFAKLGKNASTTESGEMLRELSGTFLPLNISSLAILSNKEKIAFISPNTNDSVSLFTSLPDGSKKTLVLSTKIHEWNLAWPKEDTFILTTKPSNGVLGYSYLVKAGVLNKIISGVPGLEVLANKDLSYVLYSSAGNGSMNLNVLTLKDSRAQSLSVKTLAEKCVWSEFEAATVYCAAPSTITNTNLPDDWYQGVVSFSDNVWKINTVTGETKVVADLRSISGLDIDAINLKLDSRDSFLVFTNKKDSSLWSLQIEKSS